MEKGVQTSYSVGGCGNVLSRHKTTPILAARLSKTYSGSPMTEEL